MFIKNTMVYGLSESMVAAGYPMRSDIDINHDIIEDVVKENYPSNIKQLGKAPKGSGHDNFLNGIIVQFDLCISNKAWVEAERYHFLDFVSSCSTMHKATSMDIEKCCNSYVYPTTIYNLQKDIDKYNSLIDKNTKEAKELFLTIVYNIPAGFELCARMTTNYRQLKTIYSQRRHHRLPDWHMVCDWIETLPCSYFLSDKNTEV